MLGEGVAAFQRQLLMSYAWQFEQMRLLYMFIYPAQLERPKEQNAPGAIKKRMEEEEAAAALLVQQQEEQAAAASGAGAGAGVGGKDKGE